MVPSLPVASIVIYYAVELCVTHLQTLVHYVMDRHTHSSSESCTTHPSYHLAMAKAPLQMVIASTWHSQDEEL